MPRNQEVMPVPPERVWEVLSDPRSYGYWVIGSKKIRDWDPEWPAEGAKFHHTVGAGPIRVRDHSIVEASVPPQVLRLRVKARPLGTFVVTLQMLPEGEGQTRVVMDEVPADRLTRLFFGPLAHLAVRARNFGSLGRLNDLAVGKGEALPEAASG